MTDQPSPLARTLAALRRLRIVPLAGAVLDQDAAGVGRELRDEVIAQVPAYAQSRHPDLMREMGEHAGQHIAEIRRLLGGDAPGEFAFVREQAQLRAEQRFPLEAVLHAYRCGQTVLSRWMRDAAMRTRPSGRGQVVAAVADFAIEYTNAISTILTAEYVGHTRMLAEREGDQRTQLLAALASGPDESDGRVSRLLRRAGYLDDRLVFCVALAQSADPQEMEHTSRARRIVEAVSRAVAPLAIRSVVGIRDHLVTAILSDVRRQSGWTAPRASLARRVRPRLDVLGPAVLIGLSNDQPSTSFIPRALHEATVALDFTDVTRRIVQFSELSTRRLLLHRAGDYARTAGPQWMTGFVEADRAAAGALLATLRALADADLNVQQAARALRLHPNTLYARLTRINDATGLDVRRYHDLTEVLLAADCRTDASRRP